MDDIHIYWNQQLHRDTITVSQLDIARRSPYLCFMHGLLFDTPNDIAIAPAMRNGIYEYYEIKYMKSILESGDTVIDIGSCVGLYSVLASKIIGPNGKVIAIEPCDISFLEKNFKTNCINNYIIYNKAAGQCKSTAYLTKDPNNFGNHTVGEIPNGNKVEVLSVDDVINIADKVKFIKIDTQGDEINVLRGSMKTILRNKDIQLMVEVAPKHLEEKGHHFKDLVDLLSHVLGMKLSVFAPKTMQVDGIDLTVNFSDGCDVLEIQPHDLKGFIDWELSRNPDFYTNLIAKR